MSETASDYVPWFVFFVPRYALIDETRARVHVHKAGSVMTIEERATRPVEARLEYASPAGVVCVEDAEFCGALVPWVEAGWLRLECFDDGAGEDLRVFAYRLALHRSVLAHKRAHNTVGSLPFEVNVAAFVLRHQEHIVPLPEAGAALPDASVRALEANPHRYFPSVRWYVRRGVLHVDAPEEMELRRGTLRLDGTYLWGGRHALLRERVLAELLPTMRGARAAGRARRRRAAAPPARPVLVITHRDALTGWAADLDRLHPNLRYVLVGSKRRLERLSYDALWAADVVLLHGDLLEHLPPRGEHVLRELSAACARGEPPSLARAIERAQGEPPAPDVPGDENDLEWLLGQRDERFAGMDADDHVMHVAAALRAIADVAAAWAPAPGGEAALRHPILSVLPFAGVVYDLWQIDVHEELHGAEMLGVLNRVTLPVDATMPEVLLTRYLHPMLASSVLTANETRGRHLDDLYWALAARRVRLVAAAAAPPRPPGAVRVEDCTPARWVERIYLAEHRATQHLGELDDDDPPAAYPWCSRPARAELDWALLRRLAGRPAGRDAEPGPGPGAGAGAGAGEDCPICLTPAEREVVLDCAHRVCADCAPRVCFPQRDPLHGRPGPRCPVCRADVVAPLARAPGLALPAYYHEIWLRHRAFRAFAPPSLWMRMYLWVLSATGGMRRRGAAFVVVRRPARKRVATFIHMMELLALRRGAAPGAPADDDETRWRTAPRARRHCKTHTWSLQAWSSLDDWQSAVRDSHVNIVPHGWLQQGAQPRLRAGARPAVLFLEFPEAGMDIREHWHDPVWQRAEQTVLLCNC